MKIKLWEGNVEEGELGCVIYYWMIPHWEEQHAIYIHIFIYIWLYFSELFFFWNTVMVCVITLGKLYVSLIALLVIPMGFRDRGTRAQWGEGGICLPLFVNSFAARKSPDMLTSSMLVRLRLERHTSTQLSSTTRPVCFRKNLDWPVYAWIALGRQRAIERADALTENVGGRGISLREERGFRLNRTGMAWKHESAPCDTISSAGFLSLWNIAGIANGICRQSTSLDLFPWLLK